MIKVKRITEWKPTGVGKAKDKEEDGKRPLER